jgi:hypothetical protein
MSGYFYKQNLLTLQTFHIYAPSEGFYLIGGY